MRVCVLLGSFGRGVGGGHGWFDRSNDCFGALVGESLVLSVRLLVEEGLSLDPAKTDKDGTTKRRLSVRDDQHQHDNKNRHGETEREATVHHEPKEVTTKTDRQTTRQTDRHRASDKSKPSVESTHTHCGRQFR